jgi:quercetin dioxygenase-like cupin family protein
MMNISRRQFAGTTTGFLLLPSLSLSQESGSITYSSEPKIIPNGEGKHVWAMGVHVTIRITSEVTNGLYSVFEDVVPPGAGPPLHTHTKEDETMFILEGELEVTLGEQTHTVGPGTFIHMPRGAAHRFKNMKDRPVRMLLSYTPGGFEKWFTDIGTPATKDSQGKGPEIKPEDIKRAVTAAEGYGVRFSTP